MRFARRWRDGDYASRLKADASHFNAKALRRNRKFFRQVIDCIRESRIIADIRTVIETPTFQEQADKLWSEDERLEFIAWIADNSQDGDVIPGGEGARKVRWSRPGIGKSGGARVIYFNLTEEEVVLLVALYAKADRSNMTPSQIRKAV